MTIRIVADSTCDLPGTVSRKYGIAIIPTCINIGTRTFLDGIDLSREKYYEGLRSFPEFPRTSAPGIDAFINTYRRMREEGAREVISIHPPARLSNLYNAALLAAREVKEVKVTVLDLGQVTLGTGLLAIMAARAAQAGEKLDEIVRMLVQRATRTYTFAALDTMEFLKRSGRIPALVASIGSLLNIKPVVTLTEGNLTIERVRTTRNATEHLIRLVRNLGPLEELSIVHTHTRSRAEALLQRLADVLPPGKEPLLVEATPVLGAHVGPGGVGAVAVAC